MTINSSLSNILSNFSKTSNNGTLSSNYIMLTEQEAEVTQAFAAWSAATGLQFNEVAATGTADIVLGMSSFGTAQTGIAGFTTFHASAGTIQAGAVVRVEDVADDPLVASAAGDAVYGGTDATFSQTLLHEIGHALGFGDNADPASIESYQLGAANRTLSSSDLAQAAALYPASASTAASADEIIQAMSAFAPAPVAQSEAANDPHIDSRPALLNSGHLLAMR